MAQQALRRVEFELSLLLRDQQGNPRSVAEYKEPKAFPSTSVKSEVESLAVAEGLLKRPELQRVETQLMQNQQELVLAQNQFLPRLDASVMGAKDYGDGSTSRDEAELKVGIKVEIPLMMRTQDGRLAALQAKQRELQAMKNHIQQRVSIEIRDALMVLGLARDRIALVSKEVGATQALEKGERTRYELGDSNLIFVNLREQAATDARIREIDAHLDYCRAQAAYRAATGSVYRGD
jgi:outer membrane protein TolC